MTLLVFLLKTVEYIFFISEGHCLDIDVSQGVCDKY